MALARFNFNPLALFAAASDQYGAAVLGPGRLVSDPLDALSLGLALMLGTAGLPHILMRFYTVPDARTARSSVSYATAFIGFFYLLTFILGFGAMVIVGQPAIRAIDAGGNMAAPLLAEAVGGEGVPRLHLCGRLRDDPGGGRRADARRRRSAVARPLGERGARRRGLGAGAAACGAGGDHPARHPGDRARHRLQGSERRLHGRARVRDCRQRQLSGAAAVGVLAPVHDARRPGQHAGRHRVEPAADLPVADHPDRHPRRTRPRCFPLRNPGLVSIPLSFAVAIAVAMLWPEPAAEAGFAEVERRVHTGGASATEPVS